MIHKNEREGKNEKRKWKIKNETQEKVGNCFKVRENKKKRIEPRNRMKNKEIMKK